MSFLRQYGIIIDQETGKLCSTCKAGERDLVVDAGLKEYFRTGVMPAADQQTYESLAMAYVQESAEDKFDEDQLREIVKSGAENALNIHNCFAYKFAFNLGASCQMLEFEGETYPDMLTLFVEYRHYAVQGNGAVRIGRAEYFQNSSIYFRTIYKTDAFDGFQMEQRLRKTNPGQTHGEEVFEIPTVLWAVIGDISKERAVEWENGKPYGRREHLRVISPLQARKVLAENYPLFEMYAYSLSRPESIMTGLYGEIPTDTIGPKLGDTPITFSGFGKYICRETDVQALEAADNILQTKCCM